MASCPAGPTNAFKKSGKNAMPNCAQNQTAHKTINTRKLGE
jgi:hypothetical protein